jgi:hypothetical protein
LVIKTLDLDPDPDSLEMLDPDLYPDPDSMNMDPHHWLRAPSCRKVGPGFDSRSSTLLELYADQQPDG